MHAVRSPHSSLVLSDCLCSCTVLGHTVQCPDCALQQTQWWWCHRRIDFHVPRRARKTIVGGFRRASAWLAAAPCSSIHSCTRDPPRYLASRHRQHSVPFHAHGHVGRLFLSYFFLVVTFPFVRTFQAGFILSIVAGLGFGEALFGRYNLQIGHSR